VLFRSQTRDGNSTEWRSQVLRRYQRRTLTADALIASACLAGTFNSVLTVSGPSSSNLKREWSDFSAAGKRHCVTLATTGGESSNTELLTCLEMARDVRALRSAFSSSELPSPPPHFQCRWHNQQRRRQYRIRMFRKGRRMKRKASRTGKGGGSNGKSVGSSRPA